MESENRNDVDGITCDEFSPDFEEFNGDYLEDPYLEDEEELEEEDEDVRYCKETPIQEFCIYSDFHMFPDGDSLEV